jgi:hypothetical protein
MRQNSWRGQRFFIPLLHRTKSSGTDDLFQSFHAFSNAFFAAQRAARIEIDSFRTALLFLKNVQKAAGRSVPERYRDPVCGREGPAAGDHNDRNERSPQSIK